MPVEVGLRGAERLRRLRQQAGADRGRPADPAQPDHGADRSLGLRQVDLHPQPEPDERLALPASGSSGQILYHGHDLYAGNVDRVEVRRRIGMVFQKPNPFPKSIYDNVAWAPRNLGMKRELDERVEQALRGAALWDEVKDRLKDSALGLSGGQQQRLCIARAIAIEPDVLLLDEPASALDPIATASIEDLMHSLKGRFTIVIVTHNMQQAARVADQTAFFSLDPARPSRSGTLVEFAETETIFTTRPTRGRATTSPAASAEPRPHSDRRSAAQDRVAGDLLRAAAGRTASRRWRRCCGERRRRSRSRRCRSPPCARCRSTSLSSASASCRAAARLTSTSTLTWLRIAIS